jgi:UDP-N-acetyl-D-glucosamine dehydrogenase
MANRTKPQGATVSRLEELQNKLQSRTAKIGVIGLGYVGLPLSLLCAKAGFLATGFDIDTRKPEMLHRGESYIHHIPAAEITEAVKKKRFGATADFSRLADMDAIIICVPTPLDKHREPDMSFVLNTAATVAEHLRPGQLVVLESTTYPGTTDEDLLAILEKGGLKCAPSPYSTDGKAVTSSIADEPDFFLAFSPEREDPGNKNFKTQQVPKIVGGVNAASAQAAQAFYGSVFENTHLVSSSRAAEMTKLLENIYRCVNIALVNELKLLSLRMNIDIWEVIAAAKTKPFGFNAFYPGPGLGGHCIPVDPFYLTWKAREFEFPTRFIELAGEINTAMPHHVVNHVALALGARGKPLTGSKVLVLGAAYKKDIDDVRESPALKIIELLGEHGALVAYHDPFVPRLVKMRKYDLGLESIALNAERVRSYDCALIVTDHSTVDYEMVVKECPLVVDTRNATAHVTHHRDKIVPC